MTAMTMPAFPALLLCLASAATGPTLALEPVPGGLASSGKFFVQASFDGHVQRCLLDTGATSSDVGGPAFQAYQPVGKTGRKSASNQAEIEEAISIRAVGLGERQVLSARVARHKASDASVVGMDLVGNAPFSLHCLPAPVLFWQPTKTLPQHGLQCLKGLMAVPVVVGGAPNLALWDTGAGLSCVSPALVKLHPEAFSFIQDLDQGLDGTGHRVAMKLYRAKKLTAGTQTFRNLSVLAIDFKVIHEQLSKQAHVILGYNAIRQANWDFDPPHLRWDVSRQLPAPVRPS